GFDVTFGGDGRPSFGWDADLAWRLRRAGWQSRFCETLAISTVFRPPPTRSTAEEVRRAQALPRLYAQIPEVRVQLVGGVFASRATMYFDMLLGGVLLAACRKNPKWMLTAVPWLGLVSKRFGVWPPRKWAPSVKVIVKMAALHLLWLAGFVVGSIRARRIVL
ncbi:MAG TPA: hypothetical protein VIH21_12215, partial [Dehalococcoidia bacterium]